MHSRDGQFDSSVTRP
nr:unnamed protein product [Callosobruchus chinensis]